MQYNTGRKFYLFFSLFILTYCASNFAQTKSNLDLFYSMVDSSAAKIIKSLPDTSQAISIELNLGTNYSVFGNRLIGYLSAHGINISLKTNEGESILRYVVDHTNVSYPEMFRNGFLGTYYAKRKVSLSGNFILSNFKTKSENFSYSITDTVKADGIKEIENAAFPFTHGEIPAEPFFSSLLEPAVAIGAAATAVVLFFTIRSK